LLPLTDERVITAEQAALFALVFEVREIAMHTGGGGVVLPATLTRTGTVRGAPEARRFAW
jgi:hypothetical protein